MSFWGYALSILLGVAAAIVIIWLSISSRWNDDQD